MGQAAGCVSHAVVCGKGGKTSMSICGIGAAASVEVAEAAPWLQLASQLEGANELTAASGSKGQTERLTGLQG